MKRTALLAAKKDNRIFLIPDLEATGMSAGHPYRLYRKDLIRLPAGSRLFTLPQRSPVGYDNISGRFIAIEDPALSAVGAFIPPGYTALHSTSYKEVSHPRPLPLFSYAAVASYRGTLYTAAVRVDRERRHDQCFINTDEVRHRIAVLRKVFKGNRLFRHLVDCATLHGCPGAQNFFLSRYEGPLPTSPKCNAACLGCISYQPDGSFPPTQPRIKFVPTPEEIAEIAIFHIHNVKDPVVSFGQGCEGEPLLAGETIEKSIRIIRKSTSKGIINMNTNAGIPGMVTRLFDAGLGSIRVSINSSRGSYYTGYYKPKGYAFKDVLRSIKIAKARGGFVSINYLTIPGFTDSSDEFHSLKGLIEDCRIDMVQWRNLNYDPLRYFREMRLSIPRVEILGLKNIMAMLKKDFPRLMSGYYNPTGGKIRHSR